MKEMEEKLIKPDYIFEASWEVCNKVGGIYTVLSSRAKVLNAEFKGGLFFIGPNLWSEESCPYFSKTTSVLKDWRRALKQDLGISVEVGTWATHGHPCAILVDYKPLFEKKNEIYANFWEWYGVDSLHAYGDYDDSSLFGYAAGMVIDHFYRYHKLEKKNVVAHFNEWQTGFGELYLKHYNPAVATIFTTHATAVGRSIAEHEKPLYSHLKGFNGKQMSEELNLQSKFSVEYAAAQNADCFTTVSDITAQECEQLLERKVDQVLPNGFDNNFIPQTMHYRLMRREARQKLADVAEIILKREIDVDNTIFVATSGRYEYKNKGINAFIDTMKVLNERTDLPKKVIAFILVPAYTMGPRQDVLQKLQDPYQKIQIEDSLTTHILYYPDQDPVLNHLKSIPHLNESDQQVNFVFVPSYLDGRDKIFNLNYYNLLVGFDLTIFPSYYEPWGYTPLESAAFSIPTVTTDLSGFGLWVKESSEQLGIENGVVVAHRTDGNYWDVVHEMEEEVHKFCLLTPAKLKTVRKRANNFSQKALWTNFIEYYKKAYHIALSKKINK